MKPTEHTARPASTPKTGLLATLGGLLRVHGRGASKIAPRLVLSLIATTLGALAFTAAPALAATPEAPETGAATGATTTGATLHGVLDPNAASTELVVEYEFFYNVHEDLCTEGPSVPQPPGLATGIEGEKVEQAITGLQPSFEYAACLATRNPGEKGWTIGNAVPFTTLAIPPTVTTTPATSVRATEVRLEGLVNPNNQSTECHLKYGTDPSLATSTTVACEPETLEGFGEDNVGFTLSGLTEATTYYYRVLAKNATGEAEGKIEHFTTATPPQTPDGLEAKPIAANTATLHGVLNPNAVANSGSYEFFYRQSATECQGENQQTTPPVHELGNKEEPATAPIGKLLARTVYTFCLLVKNEGGEEALSSPATFTTTAGAPTTEEEYVTDVFSTSATLHASVNPQGAETSYVFEYAPEGGVFKPVPEPAGSGTLPAGPMAVPLSVHVQVGLNPQTTYEFRLAASNTVQADVPGETATFTTQALGGAATLLDGRGWELVSPADKHGAKISGLEVTSIYFAPAQAAADGDGITYSALTPTESGPPGYSTAEQVISDRAAGSPGWSSKDISPPHATPTGAVSGGAEYQLFSEDLSSGWLELGGENQALLSAEASETTPYLADTACVSAAAGDCYVPVLTDKSGEDDDVPPGTVFGGHVGAVGASPDLQHVVLQGGGAQLTETVTEGHPELYEFSADKRGAQRVKLISILPEAEGGGPVPGDPVALGNEPGVNPISSDGTRIYWTTQLGRDAQGNPRGALYVRDTTADEGNGETVRLDVPQPGVTGGDGPPVFQTASLDGSRAFFTDGTRLTADASKQGADLYECALVTVTGKVACALRDLTPEAPGAPSEVQNLVLGASSDGSYVYFVANGVLGAATPAAVKHGACGASAETIAACNLYVSHSGEVRFIATLSSEDELDWGRGNSLHRLVARVSGNGQFAAFSSVMPLTGYDNRDAHSGKPDAEIFEYDAASEHLVCASCNPTGARPDGREVNSFFAGSPPNLADVLGNDGTGAWGGSSWVAANMPSAPVLTAGFSGQFEALREPQLLAENGRLFFNSSDSLVPSDTNEQEDAYEFEPAGAGGCSTGSATVHAGANGCTALVSSGTSSQESALLDASASGNDVFFLTAERLVPEDTDSALDVYDAHVCSISAPCPNPPASAGECATADACRTAPSPQPSIFGAPSSSTFAGAGNSASSPPVVKPVTKKRAVKCKKGKTRDKKGQCIRKKSKSKKAKKSSRRAK